MGRLLATLHTGAIRKNVPMSDGFLIAIIGAALEKGEIISLLYFTLLS